MTRMELHFPDTSGNDLARPLTRDPNYVGNCRLSHWLTFSQPKMQSKNRSLPVIAWGYKELI